jgi:hypothetical protein
MKHKPCGKCQACREARMRDAERQIADQENPPDIVGDFYFNGVRTRITARSGAEMRQLYFTAKRANRKRLAPQ